MGSIIRRGTRDKPKYYVKYKDIDRALEDAPLQAAHQGGGA